MRTSSLARTLATAAIAAGLAASVLAAKPDGAGIPANKAAASASTYEVFKASNASITNDQTVTTGGSESHASPVTLFTEQIKTSKPTDLVLEVNLECSITTDLYTKGDATSHADAGIDVWIEINGNPVPVTPATTAADDGKVTFCNRVYQREQSGFIDEPGQIVDGNGDTIDNDTEREAIRTFLDTKSTHSFTWIAPNVGSSVQNVVVKAALRANTAVTAVQDDDTASDGSAADATARAVIGKRTFVIDPVKMANGETITQLDG